MSTDLEWYLNVGGKQSGPLAAKEIVEMVRAGKIPATAQVTAARMGGDWVTAQDLIDAYDELYAKKSAGPAMPIQPISESGAPGTPATFASTPSAPYTNSAPFQGTGGDPNFSPPPRPTEHLERSKIIILDRTAGEERAPDATESLFQAIQAVREKANQKAGTNAAAASPAASGNPKDSWGQLQRPAGRGASPLLFIVVVAGILGALAYGFFGLMGEKKEAEAPAPAAVAPPPRADRPPPRSAGNGGLLDAGGSGAPSVRTAPPVQSRPTTPSMRRDRPEPRDREERLERGGGARYRDERDPPADAEDSPDVDETESDTPGQEIAPGANPVDPAQMGSDRAAPNGDPDVNMPSLRNRDDRGDIEPFDGP